VLVKAMSRLADDRYQTTIEFAAAFAAASRGEEPPSEPVSDGLLDKLFGH